MADQESPVTTEATQEVVTTPATTTPATTPAPAEKRQESFSADYVRELRQENASYRVKAQKADDLTRELEALKAEKTRLEEQHQAEKLNASITSVATQLGFIDPDDALLRLDTSKITKDDQGNATNIEALLKEIAGAKPYLVGETQTTGATNPARGSGKTPSVEEQIEAQYRKSVRKSSNPFRIA